MEAHTLHREFSANQRIQINTRRNHVPARESGMFMPYAKLVANIRENFGRKKCDLAGMIFFVIKKAVALDSTACNASYFPVLDQFMGACRFAVLTEKIVPARREKPRDANIQIARHDSAENISCKRPTSWRFVNC